VNDEIEIGSGDERRISAVDVVALNAAVGWWPERTSETVKVALQSSLCIGAWHEARLIGFARAVSDGSLRAYVEDVMVHPAHRRTGIATVMVQGLLAELEPIDVVSLFCPNEVVPVYTPLGFAPTRQVVLHRTRR
jgi:predicted GNAT family acetyltransferase